MSNHANNPANHHATGDPRIRPRLPLPAGLPEHLVGIYAAGSAAVDTWYRVEIERHRWSHALDLVPPCLRADTLAAWRHSGLIDDAEHRRLALTCL